VTLQYTGTRGHSRRYSINYDLWIRAACYNLSYDGRYPVPAFILCLRRLRTVSAQQERGMRA